MKKPFVIVFGHEKGGTGKSTLCINVAIGLMYQGCKVALLDTDTRQATTFSFFQERKKHNNLLSPKCELAFGSDNDSKDMSKREDITKLMSFIINNSHKDFVIIDTPGSYTNFSVHSLDFANLVITPVSDSILDINALVSVNDGNLIRGPYAETVFEQRKNRILTANTTQLTWFLIRNRVPLLPQENTNQCLKILTAIAKNIGADLIGEIKDRSALKDIFMYGLSVLDLPKMTQDVSKTKLLTYTEIMNITNQIINLAR